MAPLSKGLPKKFAELGCLSQETIDVLTSLGFHSTTPVQEATIPLFCGHKDVAVDACTGSGKTLAFIVPLIERLRKLEESLKPQQVGAIIISPTRELAKQIHGVAVPFFASVQNLTSMLLVGGTDPAQDVATFKSCGAHVMVGTPGRIEDVLKRCSAVDLRRLEVLVLDEADRLLDLGFKAQLDAIMARLPKQRRTGLFSATQTEAVQELARAGLRNPVRVNVAVTATPPTQLLQLQEGAGLKAGLGSDGSLSGRKGKRKGKSDEASVVLVDPEAQVEGGSAEQKTPNSLTIQYAICAADEKIAQLVRFLLLHGHSLKLIVYVMTCASVDHLALVLPRLPQMRGLQIRALHGRMKQAARERELEAFRQQPAGALLCTDLAARGLDIPDVHWVVQLDPPQDPAAFVHRVGRTARMGRSGNALLMLQPHEEAYVDFLRLRKIPITEGAPQPPATTQLNTDHSPTPIHTTIDPLAHTQDTTDIKKSKKRKTLQHSSSEKGGTHGSGDGGDTADQHEPNPRNTAEAGGNPAAAAGPSSNPGAGPLVSTSTCDVLTALRSAAERDREVMERAARAFVTYVRGYKEHHCKFIFRVQDLDVGRLATGLGLLRIPRMSDLKRPRGLENFTPSIVDPNTVPYRDKAREKQRVKNLKQRREAAEAVHGGSAAAPPAKRKVCVDAHSASEPRLPAAKRRQLQQVDEAAALNKEYSLLKKLKKGKITDHQYDLATGLTSDEEEEKQQEKNKGGVAAASLSGEMSIVKCHSDSGNDGDSDGEDGDVEAVGGRGGTGRGHDWAGGSFSATHSRGRGGRGRGGRHLQPPGGALQSYINKKARKMKKQKSKQQL